MAVVCLLVAAAAVAAVVAAVAAAVVVAAVAAAAAAVVVAAVVVVAVVVAAAVVAAAAVAVAAVVVAAAVVAAAAVDSESMYIYRCLFTFILVTNRLTRMFMYNQSYQYLKQLPDITKAINNTPTRPLGNMAPSTVNKSNEDEVRLREYLVRTRYSRSLTSSSFDLLTVEGAIFPKGRVGVLLIAFVISGNCLRYWYD